MKLSVINEDPVTGRKRLGELSLQEYECLRSSGMLWEMYSNATGNVDDDLQAICIDAYAKEDWSVTNQAGRAVLPRVKTVFFYDIIDEEAEYEL